MLVKGEERKEADKSGKRYTQLQVDDKRRMSDVRTTSGDQAGTGPRDAHEWHERSAENRVSERLI